MDEIVVCEYSYQLYYGKNVDVLIILITNDKLNILSMAVEKLYQKFWKMHHNTKEIFFQGTFKIKKLLCA